MTDGGEDGSVEISNAGAVDDEINERSRVARTEPRLWSLARHYHYEIVSSISASLFGWYVLWQGTLGPPITWPDSQLYENIAAHPIWSLGFWEGQKPPFTSLLWKLTGSPAGFDLLQSSIFVFCWVYLARTVGAQLGKGWRGVVGTWLVLGFASTTPVLLWNRSVLSDSVALSAVALLFAVIIRVLDGFTWLRLSALMGVMALNVLIRYTQFATVVFLLLVTLVLIVKYMRTGISTKWLRYVAAGLVVIAGFTMFLESKTSLTSVEITSVYQTRVFPFPNRVAWFSSHGLPDARRIDTTATATNPSGRMGKVVNVSDSAVTNWLDAHGTSTFALWLFTHPVLIFTEPFARPEQAYYSDDGVLQIYAAPNRNDSPLTGILYGTWTWLIPIFFVSLALAGLRAFWRRRECRMMLILAVAGLFTMLFAWQTDGQETDRHMLEGSVEFRLAILLCSFYALNAISMTWSVTVGPGGEHQYSIRLRGQAEAPTNEIDAEHNEGHIPPSGKGDGNDLSDEEDDSRVGGPRA